MQYFIITAQMKLSFSSIKSDSEPKQVYWNARMANWTQEKFLAKRYTSRGRAEATVRRLAFEKVKSITVEEVITVNS